MLNFNYSFNLISRQNLENRQLNADFSDINCCKIFGVFDDFITPCSHFQNRLDNIKNLGDFSAKLGNFHLVYNNENNKNQRLLYIGLGSKDKYAKFPEIAISKAFKTITNKLKDLQNVENIFIYIDTFISLDILQNSKNNSKISWKNFDNLLKQIILTINQTNYSFNNYKTTDSNKNSQQNNQQNSQSKNIILNLFNLDEVNGFKLENLNTIKNQAVATANAINFAKNLGNEPPNICTPKYLAKVAENLANQHKKITCKILHKTDIFDAKMYALYAVGQGSSPENDAVFIELSYEGGNQQNPIVLIGKGVCFDTGGICLKPPANIDEMKFDMCGAASVLATIQAVAELNLPINLKVLVPAVKNMPDGEAYLPGDVITSLSGQTIEVLNTDAEGRLILADALTYAERFDPEIVIDVATLTGACVVALGDVASGLYANDEDLAENLYAAGLQINDKCWRLPLWEEYQEKIDSTIADVANTGGRYAGSITAACFLARFAKKFERWAHLDIAGSAWKSGKEKSSTGRPVATLTQFLINIQ